MKPYRLGRSNGSRWAKLGLFGLVAIIIISIASYFGIKNFYQRNLEPVDAMSNDDIIYTLETGTSSSQAGNELEAKGIIKSSRAFRQYVNSNELAEEFIAGTYRLKKSMSVQEIVAIMTEGRVAKDLFTILPGKSLSEIKQKFLDEGYEGGEIDQAFLPSNYEGHPALVDKPAKASLEGYLYPDSYQLIRGETKPQTIITQALDEMAEALTPDIRAGISAQGLGVYEAIKLASIVEGEVSSSNPVDRPQVAQVFLSRLKIGMKLQSNATDLASEERGPDFDSYKIEGLPPEPVSNVTASALEAVANPADTDYLFFVSGYDCVTRFSRSQAEHESLIEKHGLSTENEDGCV